MKQVKNGREFEREVIRRGGTVRQAKGSHSVAYAPNGETMTYHNHGDFRPGIRCKLNKWLARAFVAVVVLSLVCTMF